MLILVSHTQTGAFRTPEGEVKEIGYSQVRHARLKAEQKEVICTISLESVKH